MRAESQSVPPKIGAPQPLAFFAVVVLVAAALGSGAVLFFFDPAKHGFYPICLFHTLTGLNCPGCGATRAAYQLLHGHLLRALHDNALFVLMLAALAARGAWFAAQKIRNRPVAFSCVAHDVVGASRHGVCIHRVAECAGVCVALAMTLCKHLPAKSRQGHLTELINFKDFAGRDNGCRPRLHLRCPDIARQVFPGNRYPC